MSKISKQEKESVYFPHFVSARHDRKIRRVRKDLGIEGYGIFFMILEVLREQSDLKYPIDDIDLLADEFDTSEEKVKVVIHKYGLFEIDGDYFYSPNQILYLKPYFEKSSRAKHAALVRWENERKKKEAAKQKDMHLHSASNADGMHLHSASNASNYSNYTNERKEVPQNADVSVSSESPFKSDLKTLLGSIPIPEQLDKKPFRHKILNFNLMHADREKRLPSIQTVEQQYRKLLELQKQGNDVIKVIDYAIEGGNKRFYALPKSKQDNPDRYTVFDGGTY